MVKGAVPGHEGSYVLIKDAVKRALPKEAPFPAALKAKAEAAE
jgi:large subunit ribosomal protein L3